ncbi:MAG: site-2 protease family protein [Egibacteraceae bacterium]
MTETSETPPTPRPAQRAGSFRKTWTFAHVRGVPLRVDVSWLVIAGLVTYILFSRYSSLLAGHGMPVILGAAAGAALLFFASLLAHELGHAITSLERDIPVLSVTLFMLGGVTESTREADSAKDEFVIVGIGPFISLVLGAVFGLAHVVVAGQPVAAAITGYLAWINVLLAIFNLVPGYPLDGGRLLRSVIWGITGNPHRSTRMAARVGQGFALLLGGYGVYLFARFSGQGLAGVWEVLIAVFLYRGAAQSHARARVRERLAGRSVRETMGSVPPTLDPHLPLSDAVVQLQERPSLLWPVGVPLAGVVNLQGLDLVPRRQWALTALREVAQPAEAVSIDAAATMDAALDRLVRAPGNMLLVVEDGMPVGLLTPSLVSDLLR